MIDERLINPREPVARSLNGSGIAQMWESQARPRPVHGVLDQPCANRIAEHVAEDCEEMAVVLNRKTFEATLPHMPMAPVMAMVAADVAGHPPLHERAEGGGGGWLHDQVEMIGHQAEAEELDGVLGFRASEQVEKGSVVAVLMEHRGTTVATIQHMVGVPGDLSARNPRHRKTTVRQMGAWRQGKVACPLFFSAWMQRRDAWEEEAIRREEILRRVQQKEAPHLQNLARTTRNLITIIGTRKVRGMHPSNRALTISNLNTTQRET